MEGLSSDLSQQNGQLEASAAVLQQSPQHQAVYASSVSLTSPEQSEPDSDFATDGAGTEAGLSRPGSSDGDVSDDSTYGAVNRYCISHRRLVMCKGLRLSSLLPAHPEDDPGSEAAQQCFVATKNTISCITSNYTVGIQHDWLDVNCNHRKRRKGQSSKPAKRVRSEVDNDQTRKLRSALPSEELSVPGLQVTNDFAHSNNQGSESAAAAELDEEDEEEEHTDSQSQRELPCKSCAWHECFYSCRMMQSKHACPPAWHICLWAVRYLQISAMEF